MKNVFFAWAIGSSVMYLLLITLAFITAVSERGINLELIVNYLVFILLVPLFIGALPIGTNLLIRYLKE